MNSSLTPRGMESRTWNGVDIQRRPSDGYVNATAMCKAYGKRWENYHRTDRTQQYIVALEKSMAQNDCGAAVTRNRATGEPELIQTIQGGPPHLQGTWVHPRIAVDLARWLNPTFAVWMDGWLLEGFAPKLATDPTPSPAALPRGQREKLTFEVGGPGVNVPGAMVTSGQTLYVTVLHMAAADLFWQQRHQLTRAFSCNALHLTVLRPRGTDGPPIECCWTRPEPTPPNDPAAFSAQLTEILDTYVTKTQAEQQALVQPRYNAKHWHELILEWVAENGQLVISPSPVGIPIAAVAAPPAPVPAPQPRPQPDPWRQQADPEEGWEDVGPAPLHPRRPRVSQAAAKLRQYERGELITGPDLAHLLGISPNSLNHWATAHGVGAERDGWRLAGRGKLSAGRCGTYPPGCASWLFQKL